MTKQRLYGAFICYALLAAIAMVSLEREFRVFVLMLFGFLALKSWIAYKRENL